MNPQSLRITATVNCAACLFILVSLAPVVSMAQGWPEFFDTDELLTLNLELAEADWQNIQNDETFDIEVPADLWLDGEAPMLVSVRRKSGDPLQNGTPYTKVSLKVDINEYVDGQTWHDLKKLSLENGDDQDVVTEGLAWYLHRLASGTEAYGYPVGLAAWVRVVINGVDTGVYVNVEQPDKQFFRNRDLYLSGSTWLYKMSDINSYDLKFGDGDSPTFLALCYEPFQHGGAACPFPGDGVFATELSDLIDMRGMLTLATLDAFTGNNDALFTHGKNAYFADFSTGRKRMYLPWDLDSTFPGSLDGPYYPSGDEYSEVILAIPEFHELFDNIMSSMLAGPLTMANIGPLLDTAESILTEALENDPNSQIEGPATDHFASLRTRLADRIAGAVDLFGVSVASDVPRALRLAQNHPNPFNPMTTVRFTLERPGQAVLSVFDAAGRRVRTLVAGPYGAGTHTAVWDGRDDAGRALADGVYLCRLDAGGVSECRKMALVR